MKIKILLVEDLHVTRSGYRALLEKQPGLEVAGETDNAADAVEKARLLSPDVVIMDIGLRGSEMTGTQATRQITALDKDIKVITLSIMEKSAYVKGMLRAGACAYLSKNCTEDELLEAIEAAMEGRRYFSKSVKEIIEEDYIDIITNPRASRKGELSEREWEVLRLTALGLNSKGIGDELDISPKTVDAHKRSLMKKLNFKSIADLIKYAIREKIIQESE
jgi:two-component system response regulator NreC